MKYKFDDISERDMDMLFAEEFSSSKEFADIFFSKVFIKNAEIVEVELSKISAEFGESDITVIFATGDKKHALLIEDKIDAIAMPLQCERYFERGRVGIENGDYDGFDVFIVAPQKYLKENLMAQIYPNKVSYEEILSHFQDRTDNRSQFKYAQISFAIYKQKHGYQVIENTAVTSFWDKYITYKETNYPQLWLISQRGVKGGRSAWPQFDTVIKHVRIYHKSSVGCIDLTIPNGAGIIVELEKVIAKSGIDLHDKNMVLVKTGKSAAIRVNVPIIDFTKPFENNIKELESCFDAVMELTNFAKEMALKSDLMNFLANLI